MITLAVAGTWLLFAAALAWARLHPPRLTDAKALFLLKRLSPDDLGHQYEPLRFGVLSKGQTGQALHLAAWFVPHPQANGRLVVILHGYSDAKIGAAAWLPLLHSLKTNVLLLDLPGHGESEGKLTTAGWYERYQVAEVLRQFTQTHPDAARQIAILGISMGAAVALATAEVCPTVAAVIADSPFSDFRRAAIRHAHHFGLPGALLQVPATWLTEWWMGLDYGEVAPLRTLRQIRCPVLLIVSGRDPLVSREDAELLQDAVYAKSHQDGISRVLKIETALHILGLATDPEAYRAAVSDFLALTLPCLGETA